MKNRIILALTLLVFSFACNDGDNVIPEETLLLRLTIDASYTTDIFDNWILVHGEDGALLASESFEANQELEIVTDKPVAGRITVTHLRHYPNNGNKTYYATSHANIEKGKHLILKSPVFIQPRQETGKFSVSVSNVPFYDHFSISNVSYGGSWNGGTGILTLAAGTYAGFPKYIVTVNDGNSLKHKVLNEVKPNDSYSFSFYDMDPFDQTVDFTFPQSGDVTLEVRGSEPDALTNNHYLIMHLASHTHNTIKAGYLNSLTNYRTRLDILYPDYAYEYRNLGAIPDGNIAWPQKSEFNIGEKSITNFSASSSKPYVWRYSNWSYSINQTAVYWSVFTSSGSQSILELPSEITSVHPALSLNNLKHISTVFYTQSPSFESIVNNDFESGGELEGLRLGIKIITN